MLVTLDLKAALKDLDAKLKAVLETAPIVVAYTISPGGVVSIYQIAPGNSPIRILRRRFTFEFTPHSFVEAIQQMLLTVYCPQLHKVTTAFVPYTVEELNDWYFSNPGADLEKAPSLRHKKVTVDVFKLIKVYTKRDEFLLLTEKGDKILRKSQIPVTVLVQALEPLSYQERWEYIETKSKEVKRFEGGAE